MNHPDQEQMFEEIETLPNDQQEDEDDLPKSV